MSNFCYLLYAGYRHVRLRTPQNYPLELATLFIHTKVNQMEKLQTNIMDNDNTRHFNSNLLYYNIGKLDTNSKSDFSEVKYQVQKCCVFKMTSDNQSCFQSIG